MKLHKGIRLIGNAGNAIIVKIPKADINNLSKIIFNNGNTNVLKNEYILGYIRTELDNKGNVVFKDLIYNNRQLTNAEIVNGRPTKSVVGNIGKKVQVDEDKLLNIINQNIESIDKIFRERGLDDEIQMRVLSEIFEENKKGKISLSYKIDVLYEIAKRADDIKRKMGTELDYRALLTDREINRVISRKDIPGIVQYLEQNTNVMYNPKEYRKLQFKIFEKLKKTMSPLKAASLTTEIFEFIIYKRGELIEIGKIDGISIRALPNSDLRNLRLSAKDLGAVLGNEKLKRTIKAINLYDVYNPADVYWSVEYNIKNFLSDATGGRNEINIFGTLREQGYISQHALYHEMGHNLDLNRIFSKSDEWGKAVIEDAQLPNRQFPLGVTDYANNCFVTTGFGTEDFAESIALYLINPKEFAKNYPNRFRELQRIFSN